MNQIFARFAEFLFIHFLTLVIECGDTKARGRLQDIRQVLLLDASLLILFSCQYFSPEDPPYAGKKPLLHLCRLLR